MQLFLLEALFWKHIIMNLLSKNRTLHFPLLKGCYLVFIEHNLVILYISVSKHFHDSSVVELVALGIDTAAEISINGQKVAQVYNMFREWTFPVKSYLEVKI